MSRDEIIPSCSCLEDAAPKVRRQLAPSPRSSPSSERMLRNETRRAGFIKSKRDVNARGWNDKVVTKMTAPGRKEKNLMSREEETRRV